MRTPPALQLLHHRSIPTPTSISPASSATFCPDTTTRGLVRLARFVVEAKAA